MDIDGAYKKWLVYALESLSQIYDVGMLDEGLWQVGPTVCCMCHSVRIECWPAGAHASNMRCHKCHQFGHRILDMDEWNRRSEGEFE